MKNNFRIPGRFLIAGILIIALCVLLLPLSAPHLVISSGSRVLYEAPLAYGICEVNFRHSVNKGMIREIYSIDPVQERITLLQGRFQNYGAGMLDTVAGTQNLNFRKEDNYFVLDFAENWQEEIRYIGGETAGHVLVYGDDVLPLGSMYPGKPFCITVSRRNLIKILAHRF